MIYMQMRSGYDEQVYSYADDRQHIYALRALHCIYQSWDIIDSSVAQGNMIKNCVKIHIKQKKKTQFLISCGSACTLIRKKTRTFKKDSYSVTDDKRYEDVIIVRQ